MNPERIFVVWVSDRPGVLTRIASVFFRRGINIVSLNVATSHQRGVSKMVIRAEGEPDELEHVALFIDRLVDVLRIELQDPERVSIDELCFARVAVRDDDERNAVLRATSSYQPRIVRIDARSMILALTSTPVTIDHFVDTLADFRLLDISRTGVTTAPADVLVLEDGSTRPD